MFTSWHRKCRRLVAILAAPRVWPHIFQALTNALSKPFGAHIPVPAPANAASPGVVGRDKAEVATLRVLVADDDVVNQKVAARMLGTAGIRPDMAANGLEAIAMHRRMPYDVILMDCQMPGMNGCEATAEIRRLGHKSRRPAVITMTAEPTAGLPDRCLVCGRDDYIAKPVKAEEVVDALRRWARLKKASPA